MDKNFRNNLYSFGKADAYLLRLCLRNNLLLLIIVNDINNFTMNN